MPVAFFEKINFVKIPPYAGFFCSVLPALPDKANYKPDFYEAIAFVSDFQYNWFIYRIDLGG